MESNGIYQFSSDNIKHARDEWVKAYKSVKTDELTEFNRTFGAVVELCYAISRPVSFIQSLGLDKYNNVLKHHEEIGNVFLTGRTARISLDGMKAIDEMTKPLFRAEQYERNRNRGELYENRS